MDLGSFSTIATPVAVGIGVIVIGVLLLIRERRGSSPGTTSDGSTVGLSQTKNDLQLTHDLTARALLDALDEAVLHVDHVGVIIEANRAGGDLFSCPVSSLVGSSFDDWLDHADRGALRPWISRLPQDVSEGHGGPHSAVEVSVTTSDGRTVPIEVTVQRPDDTGPILVRLTDRDEVAGHRRALDEARHRFHQAFHSAPTGMVLVRLDDGRIVEANESLA
ncbi:MAG: PAS domain-containing protein, partial [Actinomycetota bacterium]|nr:PAS domain-containing protein [Actinomycetota bacterium]